MKSGQQEVHAGARLARKETVLTAVSNLDTCSPNRSQYRDCSHTRCATHIRGAIIGARRVAGRDTPADFAAPGNPVRIIQ